jgi:hypothetical protein
MRLGVGCATVPRLTAAPVSARSGRETTPADPSTEGAAEETPTAVFALRIGVAACTDVKVPFEVFVWTVAEPSGLDAFAFTRAGSPVGAPTSAAASAPGVEASTVAETGAVDDDSTVASTEVDGVETSTLAPAPSVETAVVTEAEPRSTETEGPGFLDLEAPAAATCASTANPTSATTTRATSARILPC